MKKDLTRSENAKPNAEDLNILFGGPIEQSAHRVLPLSSLMVMPDFNPRTRFLNAEAQAHAFSAEALEDLVSSMSELEDGVQRGVLMPLLVRPASPGKYWIVAGERRFHAARFAGLTEVPVLVRAFSDAQAEAAAIIENAQREVLDLVSETLNAFKCKQSMI